jgi:hypothetical protein
MQKIQRISKFYILFNIFSNGVLLNSWTGIPRIRQDYCTSYFSRRFQFLRS